RPLVSPASGQDRPSIDSLMEQWEKAVRASLQQDERLRRLAAKYPLALLPLPAALARLPTADCRSQMGGPAQGGRYPESKAEVEAISTASPRLFVSNADWDIVGGLPVKEWHSRQQEAFEKKYGPSLSPSSPCCKATSPPAGSSSWSTAIPRRAASQA